MPDILLGTHAQLHHFKLWFSFLEQYDYLILDEDGHRKCHIKKEFSVDMCKRLLSIIVRNEDKAKELDELREQLFRVLSPQEREQQVEESNSSELERLLDSIKQFSNDYCAAIQCERHGAKINLYLLPEFTDYVRILIADATALPEEVMARFNLGEEKLSVSYQADFDGLPFSRGRIFQVLHNVSKYNLFQSKGLNIDYVESLLNQLKELCFDLKIQSKPWIVSYKMLTEKFKPEFQELCSKAGFQWNPDVYLGAARGLDSMKEEDIVVFGSLFPNDSEVDNSNAGSLGSVIDYSHNDTYLVWCKHENELVLKEVDSESVGTSGWISKMRPDRGASGRKTYTEQLIQAIRSRYMRNKTNVIIFCPYSLADYGIAVHALFKYHTENYSDGFLIHVLIEELRGEAQKNDGRVPFEMAKKMYLEQLRKPYNGTIKAFAQMVNRRLNEKDFRFTGSEKNNSLILKSKTNKR